MCKKEKAVSYEYKDKNGDKKVGSIPLKKAKQVEELKKKNARRKRIIPPIERIEEVI